MRHVFSYSTSLGEISIADNGVAITHLLFRNDALLPDAKIEETFLIKMAASQLSEYLAGARQEFELPLEPVGTAFQQRVWKALKDIPYGETRSYKEIAQSIDHAKAARAVGMANNKNPLMILVPCHRVIGANGKLVGYAGGLDVKSTLLGMEKTYRRHDIH